MSAPLPIIPPPLLEVIEKLVAAGIGPVPADWDSSQCRCYTHTLTLKEHHCDYCMDMGIYGHRVQP